MATTVGFIGLGTMGGHMAANLLKGGFPLTVFDVDRSRAKRHEDGGARFAASPKAVAEASEVIFTSLPGPAEVEAVALGPNGILEGAEKGTTYFDLSTNSRSVVQKVSAAFAAKGAFMLDAPVSGGPAGAANGKLALWVGGDETTYKKHKPILDAIGDQASYVGPVGQATVAKLVHNMSGYAIMTVLAEVFTMGVKAGVDPLVLFKAVRAGAIGRRRTYDGLVRQFLQDKYEPADFSLKLAHKDVFLATQLARELGVPMRLCNLTVDDMTEAMNLGFENVDSRISMRMQKERAGVPFAKSAEEIEATLASDTSTLVQPRPR